MPLSLVLSVPFGLLSSASRADITAKPNAASCYAVWKDLTPTKGKTVQCEDGAECDADGEVDQKCTMALDLCFNQELAGCVPQAITGVSIKPPQMTATGEIKGKKGTVTTAVSLPTFDPAGTGICLDSAIVEVPLKSSKKGFKPSKKLKITTKVTTAGTPKKGTNKLTLQCVPNAGGGLCEGNPQGPPDQYTWRITGTGDLDNGWTGVSHNFPNPPESEFKLCLSGCDATTDPTCDVLGPTGPDSINGETFGPPLPLLAAGIPVCVVNQFAGNITGTVNAQDGELDALVPLSSQVWFTAANSVCPQCSAKAVGGTGTCNSGPRVGKACRTESILTVALALGDDKTYELSGDCPPGSPSTFAGALDIPLPVKTGTSSKTANLNGIIEECSTGGGVQPKANSCPAGGTCNAACTGNACATTDADGNCVDAKGGISQLCCSNQTSTACHPTDGGGTLTRTGKTAVPQPAWPDETYPKTHELTGVGVFCESATDASTVNISTGLPGPGAVILPIAGTFEDLP